MAATHTYVVTSATAVGDVATVVGTVDTIPTSGAPIPVTVTLWMSAINAAKTANGLAGMEALVAPIMLAAAQSTPGSPIAPPPTVTQLPTGTFSL